MIEAKEEVNISKLYGKECLSTKEEFLQRYKIKEEGLSSEEARSKASKIWIK